METEDTAIFEQSEKAAMDGTKIEAQNSEENTQEFDSNVQEFELIAHTVNWSNICRVCANENDHIIPIFEDEGAEHDLIGKIHKYLPIQVTKEDSLPIQLCYHCASTILAWHELLEGCMDAEKQLLKLESERHKEQSPSKPIEVVIEEIVVSPEQEKNDRLEPIVDGEQGEVQEFVPLDLEEETKRLKKSVREISNTHDLPKKIRRNETTKKKSSLVINTKSKKTIESFPENQDIQKSAEASKIHQSSDEKEKNDETSGKNKKKRVSNDPYVCDLCGKQFLFRCSLQSHMGLHTGLQYYTCHICGKQFRQNGCLYYHLKHFHGGIKNHSCDICGRSFAMKSTMEDHRRSIHTGERPYVCDVCGKTFTSKASLYIHSRIHTQIYPHECKYCKKSFRWRQQLLGHLTIHTGEKNHACDVCGRAFGVKNHLTRHKRTHASEKPYTCEKCGTAFAQKRYLKCHEKAKHK